MKKINSFWQLFLLGVIILIGGGVKAQTPSTDTVFTIPYSYGFENGMGDWTTIDYNNDGHTWSTSTQVQSYVTAHSGTGFVGCSSWTGSVGAIYPDDYLVSPAIAISSAAILGWYERPGSNTYYAEHYSVYISTTGNTIADFDTTMPLFSTTLFFSGGWVYRQIDLSAFVGDTIHVAFRHHGCYDQWAMLIDDIEVDYGQMVTIPPATVPYATGFEPGDDTAWTFTNTAANGWYRGTAATTSGNSLYISADSGMTHGRTYVHGYLWASRELDFSASGDYRIGYDWVANGFVYDGNVFEYLRLFLTPQGVGLDTSYFFGNYLNSSNSNAMPPGWISLSDNGSDHYLRGTTTWQHQSQSFHIDNAGTYTLVVMWSNHDPYMWTGPSYAPPAAIDNITVTAFDCQSQIANLHLSASSNQGITVDWDDPSGSQWAVYANNILYGTTNNTSFYIANPDIAAATGGNNNPIIGVSSICDNNDTSAMATISANWEGYNVQGNNIDCDPFELPYSEEFEAYDPAAIDHLCWHHMGGLPKRVDTTYGHLSSRSLLVKSGSSYISHTITPKFNAPGNRLMVSFWALMPANDTLGRLSVGVHRHYDEMLLDSVNANIIELLAVRSGQSGWQHYTFSTESLDETGMVGISFRLTTPNYHECYIDDIEVTLIPENQDSLPPVVTVSGPTEAYLFVDTVILDAHLLQGDTTGLTYSWHSAMADAGMALLSNPTTQQCSIIYSSVGNDTVSVIAANPFGSDTVRHYISLYDNLQVSITGAWNVFVGDTMHYRAVIDGPDTAGLSYSWHSTMADLGLAQLSFVNGQSVISYSAVCNDTITLTVTNTNGIHTARRIVNVASACGTISTFPYFEGFENYAWENHEACWLKRTRSGILDNEWRRSSQYSHSGSYSFYSNGNVTGREFDAWLIMPAIELPNTDSIVFSFYARPQYVSDFYLLVSPSGDTWYDGFTDTIYHNNWNSAYNTNNWDSVSLSLDAYRNRHIRVAFVHKGFNTMSNINIDDIAISCGQIHIPDTVWHTVSVVRMFENEVVDEESSSFQVIGAGRYCHGDTATLTAYPDKCPPYFSAWIFENGDTIYFENPYSFVVTSDTVVTALFMQGQGIDGVSGPRFQVSISPNPSHGDVTVSVSEPSTLAVFDLAGRIVIPPTPMDSQFAIRSSQLHSGTYFVRVTNAQGTLVKKLVVQ